MADVLLRRTRLGLLDARGLAAADSEGAGRVARAVAGELGWDEARIARELGEWSEVARLEGLVPSSVPAHAGGEPEQREAAEPLREAGAAPEEAA